MKHIPRKRFGQNFLTDQTVLEDIIRVIAPQSGETMVEIGPGLGAMTRLLLKSLKQLHVVEIDRDLVTRLQKTFSPDKLTIHQGDALEFDFGQIPVVSGQKLRVVGNLPYNISSPLLFHLAQFAPMVQDQHFMLQREVVERMVAEPGGKAYGRLSVMLQWRYDMTLMMGGAADCIQSAAEGRFCNCPHGAGCRAACLRCGQAGIGGDKGFFTTAQDAAKLCCRPVYRK